MPIGRAGRQLRGTGELTGGRFAQAQRLEDAGTPGPRARGTAMFCAVRSDTARVLSTFSMMSSAPELLRMIGNRSVGFQGYPCAPRTRVPQTPKDDDGSIRLHVVRVGNSTVAD